MSIEAILSTCNKQAMEFLCSSNYVDCFKLLQKAEGIVESPEYNTDSQLAAVTWNNLACYYKRICYYEQALAYLYKALKVDDLDQSFKAEINLNLMAVLKEQKKYETALFHGTKALTLLKHSKNYSTLISALQNTASIYLALGKIEKAENMYLASLKLSVSYQGENHEASQEIKEKLKSLKNIEKKFYFEKVKIVENKRFLSHYRSNDKVNSTHSPIKESKSFEKSPKAGKRLRMKKLKNLTVLNSAKKPKKLLIKKTKFSESSQFSVLEAKIRFLQSKINRFESKYNSLEKFRLKYEQKPNLTPDSVSYKKSDGNFFMSGQEASLNEEEKKSDVKNKLMSTLKEFESLKRLAETEELFGDDIRSKLTSAHMEKSNLNNTLGFSLQKISLKPC